MQMFCRVWTLISFVSAVANAQNMGFDSDRGSSANATAEYVFRSTYRENLIPVQVLGAVGKPGLYFVPPRTDLVKLLTLAGGPVVSASEDVVVRKADQSWNQLGVSGVDKAGLSYEVDVKKLLKEGSYSSLAMSAQDVVYVPTKEPFISQDITRTATVVSLVMGIILTGVLIDQNSRK